MGTGRVTAEPDPTRGERDALTQNAHVSRPASGYVDRGKDPAARGIDPRKSDGALPVFPPPEATQPARSERDARCQALDRKPDRRLDGTVHRIEPFKRMSPGNPQRSPMGDHCLRPGCDAHQSEENDSDRERGVAAELERRDSCPSNPIPPAATASAARTAAAGAATSPSRRRTPIRAGGGPASPISSSRDRAQQLIRRVRSATDRRILTRDPLDYRIVHVSISLVACVLPASSGPSWSATR